MFCIVHRGGLAHAHCGHAAVLITVIGATREVVVFLSPHDDAVVVGMVSDLYLVWSKSDPRVLRPITCHVKSRVKLPVLEIVKEAFEAVAGF